MQNTITRDRDFGTLISAVNSKHINAARTLLNRAISEGYLSKPYVDVDHKHRGSALNYELYDAKDGIALYQKRYTVCTKYGNSPTKEYFYVCRAGRRVTVEQLDAKAKARVVKLAKASSILGEVINTLTGKAKHPLKAKVPANEARVAFKIVESRDASYFSIYNEEHEWVLGKWQVETATPDHGGGFYVFATEAQALAVLKNKEVFHKERQAGKKLALLRCQVSGRCYEHDNSKLCVSRCKPVQLVRMLDNPLN